MINGLAGAAEYGPQTRERVPDRKRFQNPGLATIVLGADGTVQSLSSPARSILEYGPDQPVNQSFFSMIHGRQLYQVMRDVADMVCHGKTRVTWLIRLRTYKGRWKWFKADVYNRLDQNSASLDIILSAV
jgi:hypothetical protein